MFSIRGVLGLSLAGLQLAAVLLILTLSYLTSERVLVAHAVSLMRDVAGNTVDHTIDFLTPAEAAADLSNRLARQEVVSSESAEAMEKYFFELLRSNPQFHGIFYGNAAGEFIFVNRNASVPNAAFRTKIVQMAPSGREVELAWRTPGFEQISSQRDDADPFDPRTRPWYRQAVSTGTVTWTHPYIFYSSQQPGITVATPVGGNGAATKGVVGIDIEIASLSHFIAGLEIGRNGSAFIVNENGDVIAHRDPARIKIREADAAAGLRFARYDEIADPIVATAIASLPGGAPVMRDAGETVTSFDFEGERYHAAFFALPGTRWPWTVVSYVPEDDFLGPLKANRRNGILLALAIALATGGVGLAIARSITRPIGMLDSQANRLSSGEFAPMPTLTTRYRELRHTGTAFSRMTEWLNKYRSDNDGLTAELRQASQHLESRVKERTADLGRANAALREEIDERRRAETRLAEEAELRTAQAERLRIANERSDLLARELTHRVKNLLGVVNAVLSLSAREGGGGSDVVETARRRIEALARAHSVSQGGTAEAELGKLAATLLAPYQRPDGQAIRTEGPAVVLPGHDVTAIGLMLHELATNAVKYGALAVDDGRVDLTWRMAGGEPRPVLVVKWRESGGPEIESPPAADGFGSHMLSQLARQFRADLNFDWRREGLLVSLQMQLSCSEPEDGGRAARPALV
ncbi:MAG TPA: cache domain-containing protein [Afifellaceae bacterium]|nr:cache domain-containing protein [Afifellaceae bacterium]